MSNAMEFFVKVRSWQSGPSQVPLALRACLYGGRLAQVPGLACFWSALPRSHLHKKFHSITYNVLSCVLYEIRVSPVRRDPAFAYPRSRLTGLIFLHINSAARAGSQADIVHNINFKRALVHSLKFEAGCRRKRSRRFHKEEAI